MELLAILVTLVQTLIPVILGVFALQPLWKWLLIAFLVLAAVVGNLFQHRQRALIRKRDLNIALDEILRGFYSIHLADVRARTNLMEPRRRWNPKKWFGKVELVPVYWYNTGQGDPDLRLALKAGTGVAGTAFSEKRQVFGDLEMMRRPGASRWGLTDEQVALTAHVKYVLSTPVFSRSNPDRVTMVLNLDTDQDGPPDQFREDRLGDPARNLANTISKVFR